MTLPAPPRELLTGNETAEVGVVVPGVASTYLSEVLETADVGDVFAAGRNHAYARLRHSERVVALETPRGLGLPMSVTVAEDAFEQLKAAAVFTIHPGEAPGDAVQDLCGSSCGAFEHDSADAHELNVPQVAAPRPTRSSTSSPGNPTRPDAQQVTAVAHPMSPTVIVTGWRDQRLFIGRSSLDDVALLSARIQAALQQFPPPEEPSLLRQRIRTLGEAMSHGDPNLVGAAAVDLVGLGSGSTPAGDDVIAASTAVCWALANKALPKGESDLLQQRAQALHGALVAAMDEAALGRTTSLSAELIRCAKSGHVLPALRRLFTAAELGRGAAGAMSALVSVGHTSGHHLATGAALALKALH